MTLDIHLESRPAVQPSAPTPLLPPSLDRLKEVLPERDRFYQQRGRRDALVALLKKDLLRDGAPADCLNSLEKLSRPDCLVVVTGQQPGILTGPLYTIWKVMTAVLWARRLESELGRPVAPVFWNAGEDHDTAEMNHFTWLDRTGLPVRFQANPTCRTSEPIPFGSRPVSDLDLDSLLKFWDAHLFPTEFRDLLKTRVDEAAEAAVDLGGWCNRLLWLLFPGSGLVILNSHRGMYQALSRDILRREIEHPLFLADAVNEAGRNMAAQGFKVPLHKREDRCSFFLMEAGRREAVYFDGREFIGKTRRDETRQLLERLEYAPADFSASAPLRPVIQDALLPVAVNILGPGEMAYHAQLGRIYKIHGVPRPCAIGRLHLTLLSGKVQRGLTRTGIRLEQLEQPVEQLAKQLAAEQAATDFDAPLDRLLEETDHLLDALLEPGRRIDPSTEPALQGARKQIGSAVAKLRDKFHRAVRQRDAQTEQTLQRLQAMVYPDGHPQERILNLFYFLNQFGLSLIGDLMEALSDFRPGERYRVWIRHEPKKTD